MLASTSFWLGVDMSKKVLPSLSQFVCTSIMVLSNVAVSAGLEQLCKPQHVKIHAVNTNFTLLWNWDSQNSYGVNFTAEYMSEPKNLAWQTVPGCRHVTITECSIPSQIFDCYEEYFLQVKAENGSQISFSQRVSFIPFFNSTVGPPSLSLNATSSIIEVFVSDPEEGITGRIWDPRDFLYIVEYWTKICENKSRVESEEPHILLDELEPNTEYCVRAKVCIRLCRRNEYFSPDYCQFTRGRAPGEIPYPKNLQISGINTYFTLTWDYDNRSADNVTFIVQYVSGADKSKLNKRKFIETCRNIKETKCSFNWLTEIFMGMYYLYVTAVKKGVEPSRTKELEFTPDRHTRLGAPSAVLVRSRDGLLEIRITEPRNHENKSMFDFLNGPFKYNIVIWKEGSVLNKSEITEQTMWTITDLEPWTSYCMKVQAVDKYNKKGLFGSVQCVKTTNNGYPSVWKVLMYLGISAVSSFTMVMVVILCFYYLYRLIKYTFFPSSKLPSNIEECFLNPSMKKQSLILQTALESEQCYEKLTIVVAESSQMTVTSKAESGSTHANRDSGNYSNEGETCGSDTNEESV